MLARSFITVSFFTLVSRISGFIRDILLARFLGVSNQAEAFFIALRLPNLFRRLFAEGALNAAFIPLFSEKNAKQGKEEAIKFTENIYAILTVTLFFFCLICMIFMPFVVYIVAPGFKGDGNLLELTIELTRITFPYLMAISIANLFAGILNSFSKFSVTSIMPVILNICLILFITILPNYFESKSHSLAYGVLTAGILQVLWLLYFIIKEKCFLKFRLSALKLTADTKTFFKKFAPGALGAGVIQINLYVDTLVASFISGAVAYLYYAERVSQLPLSLVGTAMGTALLPSLSRKISEGKNAEANSNYNRALEIVLLLTIPAMAGLIILSYDVIKVLFERGEFLPESTLPTSLALAVSVLGLPAFALVKVFSSCFFAVKDTKTPVISAIIALIVNIVMIGILLFAFKKLDVMLHLALPLATSIAGFQNALYLYLKLKAQGNFKFQPAFYSRLIKIIIATILMSAGLLIAKNFIGYGILELILKIAIGKIIFISAILISKAFDIKNVKKLFSSPH